MKKTCVVVSVYNGEKYIVEQLKSLIKQTKKIDKIIIVDDCSTDNSVLVIKDFIDKNSLFNIDLKINNRNMGYAYNFLNNSSNQYDITFFCDQDDIWKDNKIEVMSDVFENYPEIDVLASDLEPFYEGDNYEKWSKESLKSMNDSMDLEFINASISNIYLKRSGCTMAVKTKFLNENLKLWRDGWAHDIFVWQVSILKKTLAIKHFKSINRRMHNDNTTNIKVRSRVERITKLMELKKQLEILKEVNVEYENILNVNIKCVDNRIKMLEKNFLLKLYYFFIISTKYRKCFPNKNTRYMDLYLSLFQEYRKGV